MSAGTSLVPLLLMIAATAGRESPPVTFHRDVSRIVYSSCVPCHVEGGAAPFPLVTYADVRRRAKEIAVVTGRRSMPPWKPEPGYGEFGGNRRLADEEIETIRRWVEAGAPEGDERDRPEPPRLDRDGWRHGRPDLVLEMPETFTVPAEGRELYRCFVLPAALAGDRFVTAVEIRPSCPRVVHHVLVCVDPTGDARGKDDAEPGAGYSRLGGLGFFPTDILGGYAPGGLSQPLPEGVARLLPAGSDLVLLTHFVPTGKPELERTRVGVHFSKSKPEKFVGSVGMRTKGIDIPAGVKAYRAAASTTVPADADAIGIVPHAHYLCREMNVSATLPTGERLPLLKILDWDFSWQEQYRYAKPVRLPRGTRIDMEFIYDNSADNPRNPNHPPARVEWGPLSTNEMANVLVEVVPVDPKDGPLFDRHGKRDDPAGRF